MSQQPQDSDSEPEAGCYCRNPCPKTAFEGDLDGDDIVNWYQKLFDGATTYASILAAVMFSTMIIDLDKVHDGSDGKVRAWSAIGAILFVLLVLLCQGLSLLLTFHGKGIAEQYDAKKWCVRFFLAVVSLAFQGLLLAGTMFFCLVVKVYAPATGITAITITGVLMFISLFLWVNQLLVECWSQCKRRRGEYDVERQLRQRKNRARYKFMATSAPMSKKMRTFGKVWVA